MTRFTSSTSPGTGNLSYTLPTNLGFTKPNVGQPPPGWIDKQVQEIRVVPSSSSLMEFPKLEATKRLEKMRQQMKTMWEQKQQLIERKENEQGENKTKLKVVV